MLRFGTLADGFDANAHGTDPRERAAFGRDSKHV